MELSEPHKQATQLLIDLWRSTFDYVRKLRFHDSKKRSFGVKDTELGEV